MIVKILKGLGKLSVFFIERMLLIAAIFLGATGLTFPFITGMPTSMAIINIALALILMTIRRFLIKGQIGFSRGADSATVKDINKELKKRDGEGRIDVGGVKLPTKVEPRHVLFSGTTGSGKSMLLKNMLQDVYESFRNGEKGRVVVVDAGGEMASRFFTGDRGDLIFNLFDKRSLKWSPLAEIKKPWDVQKVAKSLIPDSSSNEENEWRGYARILLENCLLKLYQEIKAGRTATNKDLYQLLFLPAESLREIFPNYEAAKEGNEKMFGSVRSVMEKIMSYIDFLDVDASNKDFSFSDWAKETDNKAWLFVSMQPDQRATLSPLTGTIVDLIVSSRLSAEPEEAEDDRLFILIDEFGSHGRISSVLTALTEGRKFGLSIWIGLQSISQVREKYGEDMTSTMLSCLNTVAILRTNEPKTAEALSMQLGDKEEVITLQSESRKRAAFSKDDDNITTQEQLRTRRVVMKEEIMSLHDLRGFIKVMGLPVTKIEIPVNQMPKVVAPFIEGDSKKIIDIKTEFALGVSQENTNESDIMAG